MKVHTPLISWHNRERVSSVDFQPKRWPEGPRDRLASAGDDHHVVIWDVTFAADGKVALRPLSDLSRHQNTVNIVRWSRDGKTLASGDTDSAIFLWQFSESSAPDIFGDGDAMDSSPDGKSESACREVPPENWTVLRSLRGHLQDVIGLAFSPCNSFLVSCSTDSTIVVYDINKGTKVKILSEHKGWVNGVAWDPQKKVVASISSDRMLRLYRTKGYKVVCKSAKCKLPISSDAKKELKTVRLFHDDTFPSFYRRLDFSPDGELLAVPSGVLDVEGEASSTQNCTYIFTRNDFTRPVLYLPHLEPSVAVRFSPVKYKLQEVPRRREGPNIEEDVTKKPWERLSTLFALPYRLVFAVATTNAVVFYDTQQSEPFAKVSKIHYANLTDLTWSSDGSVLTVSSTDGYCTVVNFAEEEIGQIYVPDVDKEQLVKNNEHE